MSQPFRFSFGALIAVLMVAGFLSGRALAPARRAPGLATVPESPAGVGTGDRVRATPQFPGDAKPEAFPIAQSEQQIRETLRRFGNRPSSRQNYDEMLQ